jgi:hypothetical protein
MCLNREAYNRALKRTNLVIPQVNSAEESRIRTGPFAGAQGDIPSWRDVVQGHLLADRATFRDCTAGVGRLTVVAAKRYAEREKACGGDRS